MRSFLLWSERILWVVAVLCLGFYAWVQLDARLLSLGLDVPRPAGHAAARILGRLAIERLGVSAVVLEGAGARTLLRGVGHIPGTGLPDEPSGNVGIAGHRDTFFRALAGAQRDDVIELTTPRGTFRYRVEWVRVVAPDAVEVLAPTREPAVTLVTCYPFRFVGPAPLRFIVRGSRI